MDPERIWVTVFGGDEELGLGPDEEAIEVWGSLGVPDERIVRLGRADNFWQAGPTGPCGPCSELYLDRGEEFGDPGERPGDDTDRFLEFWNHVFMSYDLAADGSLTPLPMRNIDTGMGLDRMAAILQDVPSVFETDLVRPLIDLAEELSGRSLRRGRRRDAGDADRRRPLARRRLPDRRRRRPLQRRPRLHPAPDHAPRDPAGPHPRPRVALAGPLRRAHDRGHGRRLPRARRRARDDRALDRRRGGELRPHPRARHRAARAADRRSAGGGDLLDRRRGRLQAPRHLRLPLRPDQGAARRAGPLGRRRRLRGADGGAARAGPQRLGHRARLRGSPRDRSGLRRGRAADRVRRLRDAARQHRAGRGAGRRRPRPGQARAEPLLRRGRRPGRGLRRAALERGRGEGPRRLPGRRRPGARGRR